MYFEGDFENNKPSGRGVWYLKTGNVVEGIFTQKPKEAGEDEEPVEEEEEGAQPKKKFDLIWQSDTNISKSAYMVNSVEQ